jgi:flagellar basal-body rod protein FlgG
MNNSMIAASSSMGALQRKLNILADNIANVDTVGYKRKTAVFEDLLTSMQPHEPGFKLPGRQTPMGFTQGWGAQLSSMQLDLSQGTLTATNNPNDVAIEGNALFEVVMPDGSQGFTRHGAFQLKPLPGGERQLVTETGLSVAAEDGRDIIVPAGKNLSISPDGTLMAAGPAGTASETLGKIRLMTVLKPELLRAIGDNLYGVDSNMPITSVVQQLTTIPDGLAVRQGFTEQSNVNLTDEMADLMLVQRAYQLSARALSSGEQMLAMANNLRG